MAHNAPQLKLRISARSPRLPSPLRRRLTRPSMMGRRLPPAPRMGGETRIALRNRARQETPGPSPDRIKRRASKQKACSASGQDFRTVDPPIASGISNSRRFGIAKYFCHSASDIDIGRDLYLRASKHRLRSIPSGAPRWCCLLSFPDLRSTIIGTTPFLVRQA